MNSYSEQLEPFFRELERLSNNDSNVWIFLKKYEGFYKGLSFEAAYMVLPDKDSISKDEVVENLRRLIHLNSVVDAFIIDFFDMIKKGAGEVGPRFKDIIDNTVPYMNALKEGGLLKVIQDLDPKALRELEIRLKVFLSQLPYINMDGMSSDATGERESADSYIYLLPFLAFSQSSGELYKMGLCFYIAFGILLQISIEQMEQLVTANRIDPNDKMTQVSAPFIYAGLELEKRLAAAGKGLGDTKRHITMQKEIFGILCEGAEMTSKGLKHPYDLDWTKYKKFLNEAEKEELEMEGTEAGGLFGVLVSERLERNFSHSCICELHEKMFEWNEDLAYTPNAFKDDLKNEIEGFEVEKTGLTTEEFRKAKDEMQKMAKLRDEGGVTQEKFEAAQKEFGKLFKKEIDIVRTRWDVFDGPLTEEIVSNEMVDYVFKDPEESAASLEIREMEIREIRCKRLQKWADTQPKHAHRAREVVEYMIRVIKDQNTDFDEAFKVTKIAEVLKMDRKEVRRIRDKIREEVCFPRNI